MNSSGKTIVKNVSVMLVAQSITWALGFVLSIYLPRYVGATDMGKYALAGSIWTIMGMVMSTGVTTYLTKAIARNPERAADLLGTALLQRYAFFAISCVLVYLYTLVVPYSDDTILMVWVLALSQPFQQTVVVFNAVFQGYEAMHRISIIEIVNKVITVALSFLCIFMKANIIVIAAIPAVVYAVATIIELWFLRSYTRFRLHWDTQIAKSLLKDGLPYFMSGLALTFYFEVDKQIMGMLAEEKVVGWYTVAIGLTGTLIFLPNILTTAVFPALSRTVAESMEAASRLLRKSFNILLLVGIPVGFGTSVIANQVVLLIYGPSFAQSGPILHIMGFVLIITWLATLLGQFVVAADRTNMWTLLVFISTALTVPLDLVLMPWAEQRYQNAAIGGALSFAVTELAMTCIGILILPRGTFTWENVSVAARTAIAGAVMALACWLVSDQFVLVPILVGGVVYVPMVLLLRILPKEDMALLLRGFQKVRDRFRPRPSDAVGSGG